MVGDGGSVFVAVQMILCGRISPEWREFCHPNLYKRNSTLLVQATGVDCNWISTDFISYKTQR